MPGKIINVNVHSDGSCKSPTKQQKEEDPNFRNPGGAAAIITFPDGEFDGVAAFTGAMESTIGRMEITGVLCALWHVRRILRELPDTDNARMNMVVDSKFVAQCAVGLARRKANRDLWGEFDRIALPYGVGNISITHRPRNSTWEMEAADRIAGSVMRGLRDGDPALVEIATAGRVATTHPTVDPYSRPK